MRNRLKFRVERYIQRGAFYQLLVIAAAIGLVAVLGGLAVLVFGAGFTTAGDAVWWAFLRLTDPGYLGDDEGAFLRTVSTVVTVLGYVLFMGSLIAIMTQWLHRTMRSLESGLTPIAIRNHILILGWTNRTPAIVRELVLSSGRVRRFLRRHGARRLRIVILATEVDAGLMQELREQLGPHWDERQIILRSGSSLRIEHLERVDFRNAAAIILPGADFALGGPEASDTRVIKTLMSISSDGAGEPGLGPPPVVAEVADAQKIPIAQGAYEGEIALVASDAFISRLIVQNVRHGGLSYVYSDLLAHGGGHEIYVRPCPEYAGQPIGEFDEAFPRAILLGVVRPEDREFRPFLLPPPGFVLAEDDRLVLIARSYEETEPERGAPRAAAAPPVPEQAAGSGQAPQHRRMLLMGWSAKMPALLREFGRFTQERFEVDVLSVVSAAERAACLAHMDLDPERVQVRQLEGDYTVAGELTRYDPAGYDNIILVASSWLDSGEESDARTILGYALLQTLLRGRADAPEVLVELVDPENATLFRQRAGEVIISPQVVSHLLAHIALRRELNAVFGELFGPGGAEIFFEPAHAYRLVGERVHFRDVQRAVSRHGQVALGVRLRAARAQAGGGVILNPLPEEAWTLEPGDEVVVLTRYM